MNPIEALANKIDGWYSQLRQSLEEQKLSDYLFDRLSQSLIRAANSPDNVQDPSEVLISIFSEGHFDFRIIGSPHEALTHLIEVARMKRKFKIRRMPTFPNTDRMIIFKYDRVYLPDSDDEKFLERSFGVNLRIEDAVMCIWDRGIRMVDRNDNSGKTWSLDKIS